MKWFGYSWVLTGGDRRQREQEPSVRRTCRRMEPGVCDCLAELRVDTPTDTVPFTGSDIKGTKLFLGKKPPTLWPFTTMFILSQAPLIILTPWHLSAGLICPVNSMQMFMKLLLGNNMYLAHTDLIRVGGAEGRRGSHLLSYNVLQICQWGPDTAGGPSPEAGVLPLSSFRNILTPAASTQSLCIRHMDKYKLAVGAHTVKAKFSY